jgi:hypothetical protein
MSVWSFDLDDVVVPESGSYRIDGHAWDAKATHSRSAPGRAFGLCTGLAESFTRSIICPVFEAPLLFLHNSLGCYFGRGDFIAQERNCVFSFLLVSL